jgi:hypothetical protein
MENKKIVLLAKRTIYYYRFNSINKKFGVNTTMKIKETLKSLLKKNKKGLAFFTVVGQILFQILISKPLNSKDDKRNNQ